MKINVKHYNNNEREMIYLKNKKVNELIKVKTTHIIMASFLLVILLGAIILSLPLTQRTSENISFVDELFTAATSTCVTGLVTVNIAETYNTLGHVVILFLIQIGGWGVLTFVFCIAVMLHKKLGLSNQLLLQDALNINSADDIAVFVKRMIGWTLVVEGVGAVFYSFAFIPEYGLVGLWYAIFHSVSAFCNAGVDILGTNSFCDYVTNPIVNLTTCSLVVLSGLGYIVWFDVVKNIQNHKNKTFRLKNLSLHSKLVLSVTSFLVIIGTCLFMLFEYNNPNTIGQFNFINKMQASLFQSVTCRTAGFVTIAQENFTNSSALTSMVLMFIGGSPVGTAGGVKTVTVLVLFSAALATLRNQRDTDLFHRRISTQSINKSVAVVVISLSIVLLSTITLAACCDAPFVDILYETVSACATVGITRGATSQLNTMGKIIIIATMFLGRVGPISLALAMNTDKQNRDVIRNPVEEICIG